MPNTHPTPRTASFFGWAVCALAAVFYAYEYLLRIMPGVMVTELMQAFSITAVQFGLLSAFYYYAYTPMQIPVGVLMDRYGPRKMLTIACFVCALGAYFFAYTSSLFFAEIARFMMGFGSAFAFVGVLALAAAWLPPQRFALIAGLTTTLGMLGAMGGSVTLAYLVEHTGWRNTLIISAHAGVILAIVLVLILRNQGPYSPTVQKTKMHWRTLFVGFINVAKNPQVWLVGIIGALMYLSLSVFAELWGVVYLKHARGLENVAAATAASMVFFGWAIGGPMIGLFSDSLRNRTKPMLIGSVFGAIAIAIVIYVPGLPMSLIFMLLFAYGFLCSAEVVVFAIGREVSSPRFAATAIALTNMLVMLSGALFQPIVGTLLDFLWSGTVDNQIPIYSVRDYQLAMSVLPLGLLISAVLCFFVKETHASIKT